MFVSKSFENLFCIFVIVASINYADFLNHLKFQSHSKSFSNFYGGNITKKTLL